MIKAHTYTLASMQREIDALHSAWIKASPGQAPPLAPAVPVITTDDFPSGPMSDEEGHEGAVHTAGLRTPHSAFGLFKADGPVGDWEDGDPLSSAEVRGD